MALLLKLRYLANGEEGRSLYVPAAKIIRLHRIMPEDIDSGVTSEKELARDIQNAKNEYADCPTEYYLKRLTETLEQKAFIGPYVDGSMGTKLFLMGMRNHFDYRTGQQTGYDHIKVYEFCEDIAGMIDPSIAFAKRPLIGAVAAAQIIHGEKDLLDE